MAISDNKKNILFIIPSLGGGGAERVLLNILKYLNKDSFTPYLALLEKKGTYLDYLPEDLKIFDLKKTNRYDFLKIIIKLSNIIRIHKPDIVVSFGQYANLIIMIVKFLDSFNCKFCLSERNYTAIAMKESSFSKIRIFLAKLLFKKADSIIAVSKGVKNTLIKDFSVLEKKITVIYNPTDFAKILELCEEVVDHAWFQEKVPIIITMGRLVKQKGHPDLLRAFKIIRGITESRLVFIGEGQDEALLQNLSIKLGVSQDVCFLGFQKNPFKYIKKATIFVLSSLYEGFPNALVEAMACGVPVISTCCPSGPDEIITDGVDGLLVPVQDIDALANAILRLLKSQTLSKQLAERGNMRVQEFRAEKMVVEYEKVFKNLCQENIAMEIAVR